MGELESLDKPTRARINAYIHLVRRWSRAINLTGTASTDEALAKVLVEPVLGFEKLIEGPLIDVGSGNGSPGLVLSALDPNRTIVLIEPRAKRWAFLREAVRELGLEKTTVHRSRQEDYTESRAQTVTLRALALSPEELQHLLLPGGSIVFFGGTAPRGAETSRNRSGHEAHRCVFHVKHSPPEPGHR